MTGEEPSLPVSLAPGSQMSSDAIESQFFRRPLDRGFTVGRQAMPGQLVLDHPSVSSRHAAFEVANGCVVLRHLDGTNGTYCCAAFAL